MMIWESQRSLLVEKVMSGMSVRRVGVGDRSEREEYVGECEVPDSLYVFEWKSDMAVDHITSRTRSLTRPHQRTMSVSLNFARS